ncbi:MAG: hypothetical protein ACYSUI_08010 [Planctomycetota bacterium]
MNIARKAVALVAAVVVVWASGCAAPQVDFASIERPARSAELDAYNVFVGKWTWEAEVVNTDDADNRWTGTAHWEWTMDDHWLHGQVSAKSTNAEFEAGGVWGWHPEKRQYIWSMFNNWGQPQSGTAKYDADSKTWTMDYVSVGLDGTKSHGCYTMSVADENTLDWQLCEWALPFQMAKKLEMKGTYKRQ